MVSALERASAQNAAPPSPIVAANAVKRVSEHSYVIMGFPNIGFVVGNRATLVINTGMGARNGATVLREAQKLAKNPVIYLTTTHFHPEHASGAQAFPSQIPLTRPISSRKKWSGWT
jgi:glyoxylase-like metal-dependent hydrolase (beta-lactamase superfamily II)